MFLFLGMGLALIAANCAGGANDASLAPRHNVSGVAGGTTTTTKTAIRPKGQETDRSTAASNQAETTSSTSKAPQQAQATTTTTTSSSTMTTGFHGVFDFAGNNSSADASNPNLAGVVLVYYWSQIEPQKGVFDWNVIEHDMAPWVAAGKQVILRISTSGAASWDPPHSASGTPSWVFGDGTPSISDNGETLPVYWSQQYLTDYQSFVHSFGTQFDGNPSIAFIEPGIGMGGETLAETDPSASGVMAWESAGYTDALWLTTVETIASFFESSFQTTPVFPLVDMTFFDGNTTNYATLMTWFRGIPNWGLQYDGLDNSQKLGPQWTGRPVALEQRYPTRTSHDCLCGDISNGLQNLHGNYLLIYQSDIDNPSNAGYLRQVASEVSAAP